jgi:hypothetical protein
MILVPLGLFFVLRDGVLPRLSLNENLCTTIAGINAALSVWAVMGYYIYLILKDPTNFNYE